MKKDEFNATVLKRLVAREFGLERDSYLAKLKKASEVLGMNPLDIKDHLDPLMWEAFKSMMATLTPDELAEMIGPDVSQSEAPNAPQKKSGIPGPVFER